MWRFSRYQCILNTITPATATTNMLVSTLAMEESWRICWMSVSSWWIGFKHSKNVRESSGISSLYVASNDRFNTSRIVLGKLARAELISLWNNATCWLVCLSLYHCRLQQPSEGLEWKLFHNEIYNFLLLNWTLVDFGSLINFINAIRMFRYFFTALVHQKTLRCCNGLHFKC